jgi:hypothetical protein
MDVDVVCISHATGAEGERVGRLVAERLGFRYLDDEIVVAAAEREQLDPKVVADVERRKSFVARFLESLGDAGAVETYAGVTGAPLPPEDADLRSVINAVVRETAEQGRVVIASHAASIALADKPGVLRVLITGSPETRAERIAAAEKVPAQQAAKTVRDADSARAEYLRRFYRVKDELPTHYDVVVNTDALRPDEAASLVVHAARL